MKRVLRRFVVAALAATLAANLALLAVAAWATAPFEHANRNIGMTAVILARAPLAERIVIGDSRVAAADEAGGALFVGYGGATTGDLRRLTGLLCAISDAPVVLAVGVNDARHWSKDVSQALANLAAMRRSCAGRPLVLAEIWPVDPAIRRRGKNFDVAAIARINRGIRQLAANSGAGLIPAPVLSGHTFDGVHFTPAVSERYARALVGI